MSAAPRARPTMGPMTTPAIQVLLLDGGSGVDVCPVDCGVLELEEETGVEVVAMLEDVGAADVEPVCVFSTKAPCFDSCEAYCSTGLKLCWKLSQGH